MNRWLLALRSARRSVHWTGLCNLKQSLVALGCNDGNLVGNPTSATPVGLNNKGVVVGYRWSPLAAHKVPVLWWNSTSPFALDLQPVGYGPYENPYYIGTITYVGGGTWVLMNAAAINDSNWVVGWGNKNGQARAFLLKPTN